MTPRQIEALKYVQEHSPKSIKIMEAAYTGKAAARACIKAKCLDCCSFDRSLIDSCTASSCPLWLIRPRFGENKGLEMRRKVKKTLSQDHINKLVAGKKAQTKPPVREWED